MPRTATAARPRRTQAERTAATRAQLLDATIDCLHERGYASLTTAEIALRAGVSRGAQLHHFPTKFDLVIAAMEHVFARRHEEFVRRIAALPAGTERAERAIDLLWSMVSGHPFSAWLELTVAARTDPKLRARVSALSERFMQTVRQTFQDLFPPPATPNPLHDIAPVFAFTLMDGLALQTIAAENPENTTRVLNALKSLARLAIPG